MSKHVAVLMGGWSAEREVSLVSGKLAADSLKKAGYRVTVIDAQRDVAALLKQLDPKPDVVFNALHGRFGEDGCIQGVLNILDIPYTHSGLMASSLAMDKPMSKKLFEAAGIPVAKHKIVNRAEVMSGDVMERPYVIKPPNEGSSVGVIIVAEGNNTLPFEADTWPYGDEVMVEAFIPGKELTVAVMGDKPLAVTSMTTEHGFFDYAAKYERGEACHTIPADVDKAVYDEAMRLALLAHQTLGCRGISRADFRYDGEKLYILEVNTQPGLTPTSLVPEQITYVGMSFEDMVTWMVENAECPS